MAAALWASSDAGEWQAQLDGYAGVVERKGKEGLVELDRWFQTELPEALKGRQPLQLSKAELVKLMDWKLKRGKWRPNLLKYIQELPAGSAEDATRAAFSVLSKHRAGGGPQGKEGGGQGAGQQPPAEVVKQALAAVTVLKGIGPATGSAILEAADPSVAFTSDEAMQAALNSKDYTVSKVLQLLAVLRSKAAQLSEGGDRQWTAKEVEMCLWAAANAGGGAAAGAAATGSKRKR